MNAVQRLALLTLSLALFVAAPAAQARNYSLEIIVFANPGGGAREAETWRADPGLPDVTSAQPAGISVTRPGAACCPVSPSVTCTSATLW